MAEWISVSKRPPNKEDCNSFGAVIAYRKGDKSAQEWNLRIIQQCPKDFVAWMKFPEPPKGE